MSTSSKSHQIHITVIPLQMPYPTKTLISHSNVCAIYFEPVWELNNYLSKLNCVSVLKKCV